jgi:SnoaL-like domain
MTDLQARVETLERKMRVLEDALELYGIMNRYGPAVDTGSANATAALFASDGNYDTDGAQIAPGADGVRAMVLGPGHQRLLPNSAHTIGPSTLQIEGDRAHATGYSRVYLRSGDDFALWRVSANRWEFERRAGEWKIAQRTNRLIGTPDAQRILRGEAP